MDYENKHIFPFLERITIIAWSSLLPKGPLGKWNRSSSQSHHQGRDERNVSQLIYNVDKARMPFGKHAIVQGNGMFTKWRPSRVKFSPWTLRYITLCVIAYSSLQEHILFVPKFRLFIARQNGRINGLECYDQNAYLHNSLVKIIIIILVHTSFPPLCNRLKLPWIYSLCQNSDFWQN